MLDNLRDTVLHLAVLGLLIAGWFYLPEYHSGNIARILVLAIYAMGYNLLFGYTGLLSLGHALFFASGMYGLGLSIHLLGWTPGPAMLAGIISALLVSAIVGFLALRTTGVAFMIVTLMFAQAGFLTVLYFGEYTRGDEGFVLKRASRQFMNLDLADTATRYFAALFLFALCLLFIGILVRTTTGRAMISIRENEERARMLGYDVQRIKLFAVIASGTISGLSGAAYALWFGYSCAAFASVQYSIFPLLWVLLGGAGTTIGPIIGTLFMFYLIDIASEYTSAYLLVAGLVLVLLTLFAPQGIVGEIRRRIAPWMP